MYKLRIAAKAQRELRIISRLHQEAILIALDELRENPLVGKALSRNLTARFTYKIGVYRIVYKVNRKDKIVDILTAGHRKTVYQ